MSFVEGVVLFFGLGLRLEPITTNELALNHVNYE